MSLDEPVIVIGAGVVGLTAALALRADGHSVLVIDREAPAAGASAGNAGAFAFTDILPLASPGILRQAPRWLLDPLGPLSVPPAYALRIAPWMWRFWRASRPAPFLAATRAQTSLMRLSQATLGPHLEKHGLTNMLRHEGQLQVYESAAEYAASLPGWGARQEQGIEFRALEGDAIAEIQPGLSPRFTHAVFTPGWKSICDPRDYTLALAERLRAAGGEFRRAEVTALSGEGVDTLEGPIRGHVVLAAGAHSHRLAQSLGVRIPLETERGYNTTLPRDAFDLRTQVTFGGHGFVVSRLDSGIRVGGAVELAGLDRPPNWARADAMLSRAALFLPGLRIVGGKRWMGFRPSLPDSLPAIGPLPGHPNVICAFGHGHLGLTQATGTARLVVDLIAGRPPAIEMKPFDPARFRRHA